MSHKMDLHLIFQRLILREAQIRCPEHVTGRPRSITDARCLELIFRVLRSGMQWRELQCEVNYTTILRKMHTWNSRGVFQSAYTSLLRTYKKLKPTQYYCVDSAYVKNMFSSRCVGRNHTDRKGIEDICIPESAVSNSRYGINFNLVR